MASRRIFYTDTDEHDRDDPWILDEMRAEIEVLRNRVRLTEAQQGRLPSYRDATFPATASLETAIFSPGPGRGRSSETQGEATSRQANRGRRAANRSESVASRTETISTLSSTNVTRTAPSTPTRVHGRSGITISRQDRVTVNVYGAGCQCPARDLPHARTDCSGIRSDQVPPVRAAPTPVPAAPVPPPVQAAPAPVRAIPAVPEVPRPLVHHEPLPESVRPSGIPTHLRTPLRYRTPIPLLKPPNAHKTKDWYVVSVGYGTGVFKYLGTARFLTANAPAHTTVFNSVHEGWEAARDAYEEMYAMGAVVLIPCPDAMYQNALGHAAPS